MNKISKNQKGFSAVEVLLALIFLAIVAFIGVYVAHNNSKPKTTATNSTTTKTNSTPPKPANETAQAASARALTIITGLQNATESSPTAEGVSPAAYVDSNVSNGYFTSSFKTAVDNGSALNNSGQEGVSCTNNFPGSFGAGTSTLNGSSATVLLTFLSNGSDVTSSYDQVPQVTLQYVSNNWSVSGYACIANPAKG